MRMKSLAAVTATATLLATVAHADVTQATVISNGSVFEGPGTQYTVITKVPTQTPVTLQGCLATHEWCKVDLNGKAGWIKASNVAIATPTGQVVLSQPDTKQTVSTVTFNQKKVKSHAEGGAVAGAVVGAAVGGPVGAAVGAAVGAVGGAATTAPTKKTVTTYVTQNPVAPTRMSENVTVGTVVPPTVELTPVPNSAYSYIYVDGHPVLIRNKTRTVVRILR